MKIPLILIPGLLCDAEVWAYQAQHLADISDMHIPNLNNATTAAMMVASVLDNAPSRFALAGHSMGGWVALEVMRRCRERVLGLALLNTTVLPDSHEKLAARNMLIAKAEDKQFKPIIEQLTKVFIHHQEYERKVKEMLERNQSALINQEKAMLAREDCIELLKTITCPTVIIHAENDMVFHKDDANLLASQIQGAILHTIKNCGHMSPMEAEKEVTEYLRLWLKSIIKSIRVK